MVRRDTGEVRPTALHWGHDSSDRPQGYDGATPAPPPTTAASSRARRWTSRPTLEVVRPICDAVRAPRGRGDHRVRGAGSTASSRPRSRCRREELDRALADLDPAVRAGLEESIRRLRLTCEAELEPDVVTEVVPGGHRHPADGPRGAGRSLRPGRRGAAGVQRRDERRAGPGRRRLARSRSPPRPQKGNGGLPHPTILAACALLGIDEVYAVGGAQAIAMFAYGAGPCRPVDMVTGPGQHLHRLREAAAQGRRRHRLRGRADRDRHPRRRHAPTPAYVAADLISQAEHDPHAASVLVTPSERLAADVEAELDKQVSATKHVERIRTALSGRQSAIVLVDDLEQGLAGGQRVRRRAPRDPDRGRRALGGARAQRRRGVRRRLRPGLARRLRGGLQPRPAHRLRGLLLLGAVGALLPQGRPRRRLQPTTRCATSPTTW